MSTTTDPAAAARRLAALTPARPVISLYVDLDPSRFATPPARATEINSLLDEAGRRVAELPDLSHEDQAGLREGLAQLATYFEDLPAEGVRGLAVFCSAPDGLFEVLPLALTVERQVVIDRRPFVEPLSCSGRSIRWLVGLVSRRDARFFSGPVEALSEQLTLKDDVHGQHSQGGWSQGRYERSVEEDVDEHLRHVAAVIAKSWRTGRFDRIALGGPVELVPRLRGILDGESAQAMAGNRLEIDVESAGVHEVTAALEPLAAEEAERRTLEVLERLHAGVGAGAEGRAVAGLAETLEALNQHRVEYLLLAPGFAADGGRCPMCEMLLSGDADHCPGDGLALEPRRDELMREAMVEAALRQDANVLVIEDELGPLGGVAAVLRY